MKLNLGCLILGHSPSDNKGRALDKRIQYYTCEFCDKDITADKLQWVLVEDQ